MLNYKKTNAMQQLTLPPNALIFILMFAVVIFFPYFWQKAIVYNKTIWPRKNRVLIGVWYIAGIIFSLIFIFQVKSSAPANFKTMLLLPQSGCLYVLIASVLVKPKQLSLIETLGFGVYVSGGIFLPLF
jgi:hypothetical protein